jgi:transposase
VVLQHLLDEGLSKAAIARQLGVSRRIVYYWLASGQVERDLAVAAPRVRARGPTKLEPYQAIIAERLATYPELSAVRLLEEVRAAGYPGGITQLREYVARVRPRPEPEPVVRFETPAGLQAQVDFATFRFPWGKRYALLVVLGYSRLLWLQFYARQTMRTVIEGLEAAFAFFGGVPRELLFDQMKAVVLEDQRPQGRLLENAEFLRFAHHWGFRIRACRPYRAKTKGKVERPIGYVRQSFIYGREFLGDADLAAQAATWLEQTANARVHGTTQEVPRARFERDERARLQPPAARPYQSLLALPPGRSLTRSPQPHQRPLVTVERRDLTTYAALAASGV